VKYLIKQQTLKGLKLAQLDMKLYKWVTAIHSEGNPIIGHMIIEKAKSSIARICLCLV